MQPDYPFHTLAPWLRSQFGRPVRRIALDAGDLDVSDSLGFFEAPSGPIDVRQLLTSEEDTQGE